MTKVQFPFNNIRYVFEADIPPNWFMVTEREFGDALDDINWNAAWYGLYCIYRNYDVTIGVQDGAGHKWYLNPDYFDENLNPIQGRVMLLQDESPPAL